MIASEGYAHVVKHSQPAEWVKRNNAARRTKWLTLATWEIVDFYSSPRPEQLRRLLLAGSYLFTTTHDYGLTDHDYYEAIGLELGIDASCLQTFRAFSGADHFEYADLILAHINENEQSVAALKLPEEILP